MKNWLGILVFLLAFGESASVEARKLTYLDEMHALGDGMISYNTGKAEAFMAMEASNFADCAEVIPQFDNQKIFQSVLYSDGRIKMYDGTIIKPRKPYDASKLYVKDREAFLKADAAYKKAVAHAQKLGQTAQKVPLKDANYENFAREFSR